MSLQKLSFLIGEARNGNPHFVDIPDELIEEGMMVAHKLVEEHEAREGPDAPVEYEEIWPEYDWSRKTYEGGLEAR